MVGVAASNAPRGAILVAGAAGLVAGSMSMAVGEYVSVSSQRDAEVADIARETAELASDPKGELGELTAIYQSRGLDRKLALQVAKQLSKKDRLAAHLRDELGIHQGNLAQPFHAAWVSALSFALFALIPILALLAAPSDVRLPAVVGTSLASLAALGALGARWGGAPQGKAALRVLVGGALAMALTALIGKVLGVSAV